MKTSVIVDVLKPGSVPRYDKDLDRPLLYARTNGGKHSAKGGTQATIPTYKVTPGLLRAMADTLDVAEKEGRIGAALVVSPHNNRIGLVSV